MHTPMAQTGLFWLCIRSLLTLLTTSSSPKIALPPAGGGVFLANNPPASSCIRGQELREREGREGGRLPLHLAFREGSCV